MIRPLTVGVNRRPSSSEAASVVAGVAGVSEPKIECVPVIGYDLTVLAAMLALSSMPRTATSSVVVAAAMNV